MITIPLFCSVSLFDNIKGMTDTIIDDSQVRPINFSDCEKALTQVRSSVSHSELLHYTKFDDEFGSK